MRVIGEGTDHRVAVHGSPTHYEMMLFYRRHATVNSAAQSKGLPQIATNPTEAKAVQSCRRLMGGMYLSEGQIAMFENNVDIPSETELRLL